jgi:hypothetical protein
MVNGYSRSSAKVAGSLAASVVFLSGLAFVSFVFFVVSIPGLIDSRLKCGLHAPLARAQASALACFCVLRAFVV